MHRRSVEVIVAGQKVKLVSTATDEELRALAAIVSERVEQVAPRGRPSTPQALVLAAMSLAHDLEVERGKREVLERKARDSVRRMLVRVDQALEGSADRR
jgi:cell division protein ZapA